MLPLRDINPSRRKPWVTWLLVAANVAAFVYELTLGERLEGFVAATAFVPARMAESGPLGLGFDLQVDNALWSMFLHGGFAHIGGNMLFLWIFGDNVEDRLGHLRYLLFYLGCGFAAVYAHAATDLGSTIPMVGASGAIAGVLGAYLVLYPRARIVTLLFLGFFFTTVEVPAILYLPLWFLTQFFAGVASLDATTATEAGGVAWFAHIGGFVAGPVLLYLLGGRSKRGKRRPTARDLSW